MVAKRILFLLQVVAQFIMAALYGRYMVLSDDLEYGDWACFVIEEDNYGCAAEWCQAVSAQIGGVGISVFLLEYSWDFNLFEAGSHVAGRQGYPHPEPYLIGDLETAAELLQVSRDVFTRYCVSPTVGYTADQLDEDEDLADELDERFGGYRAFEGDEFEPWDEWGFTDFLKKLGFDYPDPGDRTAIEVSLPQPAEERATWAMPPAKLDDQQAVHKATQPPNPSTAKPATKAWWRFW